MTVYVDLLFSLNVVVNYLLLRGSAALGGCAVKALRLAAAAGVGGLYAVLTVLPVPSFVRSSAAQGLCAGLMLLLAFGFRKNTLKQGLFFFALSFAFGGAVLLLIHAVEPDCIILGGHAYYALSMPALMLVAGVCYGIAAFVLKNCGAHTGGDILPVTLLLEGRSLALRALRDTGNTLTDPVSGQQVLVVEAERLLELFPRGDVGDALFRDPAAAMETLSYLYPTCRFRLVSYRAVGVETGLLLAVRCRGKIGKSVQPMLAAFSPSKLSCDETFNALWGGAVT